MTGIQLNKEVIQLIKERLNLTSTEDLKEIGIDAYENSYEFLLCESMDCEEEEIADKIRERLIEKGENIFTDSDLEFSDLSESIELFLYKVSIDLIEDLADNYSEDDDYDMESNSLGIELMEVYASSATWCDFIFNRNEDTLTVNTTNYLDFNVQITFDLSRMSEKEYVTDILLNELKRI